MQKKISYINMTKPRSITPQTARRLAVSSQLLTREGPAADKDGIMELFKQIGCVQIDPIRAVERTQYLVLFSRLGAFDPTDLEDLLYKERRLFEYWAHAASIVRTQDYPLFQIQMREWDVADAPWDRRVREWVSENTGLRDYLLNELRQNGPLTRRDFEDRSETAWESGGWTSGQGLNIMLGDLYRQGAIMVSDRKGLTKYWELSERCLPEWTPREELDWPETVYRASQRSLRALGVARPEHIANHFTRNRYPGLESVLERLETEDRAIRVSVEEKGSRWPGDWYVHADDLARLEKIENGEWFPQTTLLSPFDNLICDRDRTEELFGFRFRIEIYVPKAKREYGYYVMPVLHGDRLIGRVDPKMNRKQKRLDINAVYLEQDVEVLPDTGRAVANAVAELARFLGAGKICFGENLPGPWREILDDDT